MNWRPSSVTRSLSSRSLSPFAADGSPEGRYLQGRRTRGGGQPAAVLKKEAAVVLEALASDARFPRPRSASSRTSEPEMLTGASDAEPDFARQVLQVAEIVILGAFLLLVAAAVLAARFGNGSLPIHELPFAGWGLAAALASLALATLAGDKYSTVLPPMKRRLLGGLLMAVLLVSVTG